MDGRKGAPLNSSLKAKLDMPQKNSASSPIRKPRMKDATISNKLEMPSTARTSRRYPSPNVTRNPATASSLPKRPQSAERRSSTPALPKRAELAERRPSTPSSSRTSSLSTTPAHGIPLESSGSVRRGPSEGIWPTIRRNLSSAFQLESVNVNKNTVNSTMSNPDQLEKNRTPLGQSENTQVTVSPISKMMEKQRWPGMAGGKTESINLSRSVDLTDKITRPGSALSLLRSRGTSPKRLPVSGTSNSLSRNIENGAVSKLLAQLGPNAASTSVDLPDRTKKPISRGNSPRRTFSSNNMDNKYKDKRPESRGSTAARTITATTIGAIARSESVDTIDETKKPVSSSPLVQSRRPSPLRIPANETTASGTTKRPESRGSLSRTSESEVSANVLSASADLGDTLKRSIGGASPGTHSVSELPARDIARSIDLNKNKRPVSSSGQRNSVSNRNSETDDKMGLGPNTPPQRSERSNSLTRASRTLSSPISDFGRPSSSSSKRLIQSPLRGRPSTPSSTSSSSCGGSIRRTNSCASLVNSDSQTKKVKNKVNGNQMEELHQLRLLHSRLLQWLFVNSCIEDMHLNQNMSSKMKRLDVQQLAQETKLVSLVNEQIVYLDSWSEVERAHCTSLAGAIEAIRATTIHLPVTEDAKVNVHAMRNAVSSAVDIMQTMCSFICILLSKVEDKNSLVKELAVVSAKEMTMLEEGRELLATIAKLHVQECSLKTQLVQQRQGVLEMNQIEMGLHFGGAHESS